MEVKKLDFDGERYISLTKSDYIIHTASGADLLGENFRYQY